MDFAAYLVSKNIDNQKFADTDKALFDQWEREFMQMNPKSFTLQKLFKINEVRRKYQLHMGAKPKDKPLVSPAATAASKSAAIPKPAIKADITNVQSTENPTDKDVVNPTTPT
ncbi:MAG TPA: hypothetical protein VL947_04750, partial [Cytophagales bacterium]|nr:hypothetical protein [Cytophagales bacterium]